MFLRNTKETFVFILLFGCQCHGFDQVGSNEQVFDPVVSNEHSFDSSIEDDREFETSAHHSYRGYYVLNKGQQNNYRGSTSHQRTPSANHGVWYPKQQISTSNNHNQGGSTYNYNTPNPQSHNPQSTTSFTPQQGQIRERLRAYGFSQLSNFIDLAGLSEALDQTGQTFTVFAPSDEAFKNFINNQPEDVINTLLEEPEALKELLLHHVVPGKLMAEDLKDQQSLVNLRDQMLKVLFAKDDDKLISGSKLMTQERRVNIQANNGIIHGISDVIYPFASKGDMMNAKGKRILAIDDDDPELIKKVQQGSLKGINLSPNVRAWFGVPYAQPPVGELRFSPPVDLEERDDDDVLETRSQPNSCIQALDQSDSSGSFIWNTREDLSEDCLYLNIYAPRNASELLPVLVWIHGGSHSTGAASLDIYDGQQLALRGEIIFVAIQFRLGPLGFMYLGERSGIPGNMGLLDQVKALDWISQNIQTFNGDPNDVTLMGESSGAHSVALHMISPKSEGLFHKAILQSAGLNPTWGYKTPEMALENARKLSSLLDCPEDPEETLTCLREKDAEEITSKAAEILDGEIYSNPFVVTLDGNFITEAPQEALENDVISSKIPVLLGSNANEGFYDLMAFKPDIFPDRQLDMSDMELSEKDFEDVIESIFPNYPAFIRRLIRHEYKDMIASNVTGRFQALDQIFGDASYVCDTEHFAQTVSGQGNNVYRYHFNHRSSQDPWPKYSGSKHGDEIEFVFGSPLKNNSLYNGDELSLTETMMTYWLNFIKTGNPNPLTLLTSWPKYEEPRWAYLNLTAEFNDGKVFERGLDGRCEFWNEILPALLKELNTDVKEENQADEEAREFF
ncbi:cholinesterase-like [Tigriopus californicus]|uniref:cholinesterase-like n=1 Tax=Tigriopus californicus TaxID=6832 RepID=UPI0027DA221C|nr:cholinesterase-like [Tigriopus californicus]